MKKSTIKHMMIIMAVILLLGSAAPKYLSAQGEVKIVSQPHDVEVAYPDGASFAVEVEDPEAVASYQWVATDGFTKFVLDGKTAYEPTLIVPSTMQDDHVMFYQCEITGKDGSVTYSDPAVLTISNSEVDKPVLYVGEHAVEPGETLDLATTTLGNGTIVYDANGIDIDFNTINIDNSSPLYDSTLANSMGLFLVRRQPTETEFHFHFNGDCRIKNTFFQPEYNSAGVVFNSFFGTGDTADGPVIVVDGEGTLYLEGGSNAMYTDGSFELNKDIITHPNGDIFNDGIRGFTIIVDEGVNIELNVNGTGIHTEGDLRLFEGSKLDIISSPPHVSVGPTAKSMMFITGSIYAKAASINLKGTADPERFVPYGSIIASFPEIMLAGEGAINLDQSSLQIEIGAMESQQDYAMNFLGVIGEGENNAILLDNGSSLKVAIDSDQIYAASGVNVPGIFEVEGGSEVSISVKGKGESLGIEADRSFTVSDSNVAVDASSYTDEPCYGIVCGEIKADLSDPKYRIASKVSKGIAIAADTGELTEEEVAYAEDYEPKKFILENKASILTPEKGKISLAGVPGYASTIVAETVYAQNDTSIPATEAVIGVPSSPFNGWMLAGIAAAVCLMVWLFVRNSKKKK